MSTAGDAVRNGLLLEGLGKPVDLNAVDWHVRHRNPSASPSEIQNETLEFIRAVVSDGLFRLGSVGEKDERFVAWRKSLDHSIHKISHVYVNHYDDPERWMFRRGCRSPQRVNGSPNAWKRKTSTYIGARASEAS